MAIKSEDIVRGDLVELALTSDANRHLGLSEIITNDERIDVPGRIYSGYVADIQEDFISLVQGWNKLQNKPDLNHGNHIIRYYFDAVESCRKR